MHPASQDRAIEWQRSVDEATLPSRWHLLKDDDSFSAKRSRKTAREMGHLPLWGERGMLKRSFRLG